jgi:hypothetical protein
MAPKRKQHCLACFLEKSQQWALNYLK